MEKSFSLNAKNTRKYFKINPENPFFQVSKIVLKPTNNIVAELPTPIVSVRYIKTMQVKGEEEQGNLINSIHHHTKLNNLSFELNKTINTNELTTSITFVLENLDNFDGEVFIHFTTFDKKVEISTPILDFKKHLDYPDNTKILFSAPFGQGKTTFLNIFFEENIGEYEVFKLFPVNYSISHNEDVFKYIKCELLFQLLGKDIEFDQENFSYLQTAPEFFKNNAHRILSPFLHLLPKVGKSALDIYEKLFKLAEKYFEYHNEIQVDDQKKAIKFINELYEKEGSVFEDNFFTQLIRQLIDQLRIKTGKKCVLVIDDIDRMDPDHIFRIFNVFAAHFDSNLFQDGESNKLGLDKVIIVCDYDNIKNIFTHRYGSKVKYDGYLSKYFSRAPFYYDNDKAIETYANILTIHKGQPLKAYLPFQLLIMIVNDLIHTGQIALRDIIKLNKFDFIATINQEEKKSTRVLNVTSSTLVYFNVIAHLMKIFSAEILIDKVKTCGIKVKPDRNINYTNITTLGLVPLINSEIENNKKADVIFKNSKKYNITIKSQYVNEIRYHYHGISSINNGEGNVNGVHFNAADFYDMLVLNIEKYANVN